MKCFRNWNYIEKYNQHTQSNLNRSKVHARSYIMQFIIRHCTRSTDIQSWNGFKIHPSYLSNWATSDKLKLYKQAGEVYIMFIERNFERNFSIEVHTDTESVHSEKTCSPSLTDWTVMRMRDSGCGSPW